MTPSDIVKMLRQMINDEQATGFVENGNLEEPDAMDELICYLDRAIDEYCKIQANKNDLRLLKRITAINNQKIPDDFLGFCGSVPINIESGRMEFYGSNQVLPVRYFARLPYVSSFNDTDTLPYERDQAIKIASLASIYALNKHEYNVTQDLTLLGMGVENGNIQR